MVETLFFRRFHSQRFGIWRSDDCAAGRMPEEGLGLGQLGHGFHGILRTTSDSVWSIIRLTVQCCPNTTPLPQVSSLASHNVLLLCRLR